MKRGMFCMMLVALVGCSVIPASAEETVAGEWKGTYTGIEGRTLEFYLTLKQEGEKVSGTYFNPAAGLQGRAINRDITGTFKDSIFNWGTFKGTVTGDKMEGTFPAQAGRILNFTAVRTKK